MSISGSLNAIQSGLMWTIITVLFLWTVATIAKIHDQIEDVLVERFGKLISFVPNYNFFAPTPGHTDYYLLYRDELSDGSVTDWRETNELTELPTMHHWFWNPNLYNAKALFDFSQFLVAEHTRSPDTDDGGDSDEQHAESKVTGGDAGESPGSESDSASEPVPEYLIEIEDQSFQLSLYYMQILNYVTSLDHHEDSVATQFLIMTGSIREDDEPIPRFVSNYHEVPQ